jgi:hypothetical protein
MKATMQGKMRAKADQPMKVPPTNLFEPPFVHKQSSGDASSILGRENLHRRAYWLLAAFWLLLSIGLWLLPRPIHSQASTAPTALDQNPAIVMTMTVDIRGDGCTGSDAVTVLPTTTVHLCYSVLNSGDVTFTDHILSGQGFLPIVEQITLPPGATITRTRSAQFAVTTTQADTWAANSGPGSAQVQAQDSVAVTVISPAMDANLTVGQNVDACATTKIITVPSNSTAVFCLTITNTGDALLTRHAINIPVLAISGTITASLAPGQILTIDNGNASTLGLPANFVRTGVTTNLGPQATVQSSTAEGYAVSDASSAGVTVGNGATTLQVTVNQAAPCGTLTTINPLRNTNVYFCLNLTNTGTVSLTNFQYGSAVPVIQGSFTYTLAPNAKIAIDNPFLTGLGAQAALGPYQAAISISPNFVVTATNASGFSVISSGSVSVVPVDPTATWTPTWTPIPPTPTWTPFPTWTSFPTWTPTPTWTPFPTIPPTPTWTPTWTRSFDLSNLQTPTPLAVIAAADPLMLTLTMDAEATNAALLLTTQADALATSQALAFPTDTPLPSPLDTPTPDPALESLSGSITQTNQVIIAPRPPTATPTSAPSPTPSPTQRSLTLPTPTALPNLPDLFSQVLSSAISTLGILWFLVGSLVFFVTAGVIAGMSFRQSNRQRYNLYALEEVEDEEVEESEPTSPASSQNKNDGDHWPTSLQ